MTDSKSRALASFIGLAIGDALGAPIEFLNPGSFAPIVDYTAGGTWNLPAGYWTDDTSMAICLAENIIANRRVDPQDLLERFSRWYQFGENSSTGECFDIGNTTVLALRRFVNSGVYLPASNRPELSGNGSLMRLSPVAVAWWSDPTRLRSESRAQTLTTHGSQECIDTCEELALMLGAAIRGQPVHEQLIEWSDHMRRQDISNSGRASDTLRAAKWAVGVSRSFRQAVLAAVNLGGDSDTIGAVAGQLAGAIWGMEDIPAEWIEKLYNSDRLLALAEQLWLVGQPA